MEASSKFKVQSSGFRVQIIKRVKRLEALDTV